MQTRRELLQQALAVPLLAVSYEPKFQIISESNCLSQESAQGFDSLLSAPQHLLARRQHLIVAAGVTHMRPERVRMLRLSVERGALLIWESAGYNSRRNTHFEEAFGVKTYGSGLTSASNYVEYCWPRRAMVRLFGHAMKLECPPTEAIAYLRNKPVAMRKQVGQGTLFFLGSMLGPHLRAGDRDSIEIARRILLFRS